MSDNEQEYGVDNLTAFRLRLLAAISRAEDEVERKPHGRAVADELNEYFQSDVNNPRLYNNLRVLEEDELVDVGMIDARTNSYTVTELGERVLNREIQYLGGGMA